MFWNLIETILALQNIILDWDIQFSVMLAL